MRVGVSVFVAALLCAGTAVAQERSLPTTRGRSTDDFAALEKRRMVRILVPYGRPLYYYDGATPRGTMAQAAQELETELNRRFKAKRPFVVAVYPTTRDRLLPALVEGEGDIAGGNITVTPERSARVAFTNPTMTNIAEIIVTGPEAPPLRTIDDLAGQEVHVRPSTSYYQSLSALNERFRREGKPPMVLRLLPDAIEDEDKLDMVDAGLIRISVVDDWIGRVWEPTLEHARLRPDLVVRQGGEVAWAVRKNNPQLLAILNEALARARKRSVPEVIVGRAGAEALRLHNATSTAERKKFDAAIGLFRKYGDEYGFDALMLAAQGYQESRLDQKARSRAGAIGVMQLMPKTGKEQKVGDIRQLEPNVHAGARYMSRLIERYFSEAHFDEENRTLFAFAAYNCGPGNISRARKTAEKEGLDPNVWFHSVEHVVARQVGTEPVRYVRNIYKYYAAYKLALAADEERSKAIEAVRGSGAN